MSDLQHTIKQSVRYSGISLHTGHRAHITFKPADAGTGIIISRVDLPGKPLVEAHARNVVDVVRATTIKKGEAVVHTVEHVLAALYALGIDNCLLEMDGPEPPIADGSSKPYIDILQEAGSVEQGMPRRTIVIDEPIYVEMKESRAVILPYDHYRISCTVKYGATLMDTQYMSLPVTAESFCNEMCEARTFCLYEEIAYLMNAGLIRGGSLDNAVVMKDGAIISKDGLRYPDEFVRHKMLDIVGDLSLVGCRLQGQIIAIKPGHPLNVTLAQAIVKKFQNENDKTTS